MEQQKHILIIEDEHAIAEVLQELLTDEGFKVTWSVSGKEGLEQAQREQPDLVILDVMLPEMNGKEVLKHMREDERLTDTPVFVMTNVNDTENIVNMSEVGKTSYFLKVDISLETLLGKIKKQLNLQ